MSIISQIHDYNSITYEMWRVYEMSRSVDILTNNINPNTGFEFTRALQEIKEVQLELQRITRLIKSIQKKRNPPT